MSDNFLNTSDMVYGITDRPSSSELPSYEEVIRETSWWIKCLAKQNRYLQYRYQGRWILRFQFGVAFVVSIDVKKTNHVDGGVDGLNNEAVDGSEILAENNYRTLNVTTIIILFVYLGVLFILNRPSTVSSDY